MSDVVIQASFNSGEWSSKLFARVDLAKYKSGAANLRNWFVDYRGGASTRPGTRYILQAYKSATAVRLIPFQASSTVGYVLEFGDQYIRFFFDGAPVLETAQVINAAIVGNPTVFGAGVHGYVNGNWIYVSAVAKYYIVQNATATTFTLTDLFGNAINNNPFVVPVDAQRVYTIASPYAAADLRVIKFAQNVNQMILCHPNYPPQVLTLVAPTNWNILPITFGTSAATPAAPTINMTPGGAALVSYSYKITAIDSAGQESVASTQGNFLANADIRTTPPPQTISITWAAVAGAVAYNVYKASISGFGAAPAGAVFGFIGTTVATSFIDDNIAPDFSTTPPLAKNPFAGQGVASVAVTAPAPGYVAVPTVTFTGAASTIVASAIAILGVQGTPTVGAGGAGYAPGDLVSFTNGVVLIVATVAAGAVTSWQPITTSGASAGSVSSGATPANPVVQLTTSGGGAGATANLVWGVNLVQVLAPGAGYTSIPTVTFSFGAAGAIATLSNSSNGYPSVPGFFQQRLVLAAPLGAPQTLYMSQPGAPFNFNTSIITLPDDAITGSLVSGQLNTIKALVAQTSGLLVFTDRNSWLVNGGTAGAVVTPASMNANPQSFNGISDVPPIIANFDVLYVQAKGSSVRDSTYNIYSNVYTGTDISVLASHLFFGYTVDEWAWAEEPFKLVWGVRSDGQLLTLTFVKEQEFIGWTHGDTQGLFKSVATVVETTADAGDVDAIYFVVERTVQGQSLKYIERLTDRIYPNGVVDAWCVDCGIGYDGAPATNFSGAEFLGGLTVTGLADGVVIPPFVMNATGTFTLPAPASKVVVGLPFTAQLQTMPLDMGDPSIQGKVKKINAVDARVAETLGLYIGGEFGSAMVPMKDLIVGNVSSMLVGQSSQLITDLVTGDARTFLSPSFTVPGQYCLEQRLPLPASVLGLISDYTLGDTGRGR